MRYRIIENRYWSITIARTQLDRVGRGHFDCRRVAISWDAWGKRFAGSVTGVALLCVAVDAAAADLRVGSNPYPICPPVAVLTVFFVARS